MESGIEGIVFCSSLKLKNVEINKHRFVNNGCDFPDSTTKTLSFALRTHLDGD